MAVGCDVVDWDFQFCLVIKETVAYEAGRLGPNPCHITQVIDQYMLSH